MSPLQIKLAIYALMAIIVTGAYFGWAYHQQQIGYEKAAKEVALRDADTARQSAELMATEKAKVEQSNKEQTARLQDAITIYATRTNDLNDDVDNLTKRLRNNRTIHDFKTTNDFRYAVYFIMADATDADAFGVDAGTVGLLFTADNIAGNITPKQEFIRVKNYNVNIPSGFYKATLYWHRSAAYDDLTTGRFVYIIKDLDTGEETTVFDINPDFIAQYNIDHPLACTNNGGSPATNCVNRHMGITGNAWQRLFMLSNYHGGWRTKMWNFGYTR